MLRIKSESDGSVTFEGYANKAIVDRGNDLIGKKAWKLDNYKKNPIILFNHDHTKPIGKMIKVEAKEDGLFVKGRISSSRDPEISRIRDLVKEGVLNSLSVGMRVFEENREGEVNVIKQAELHEISVVAVPMNQDSQFTASIKSMEGPLVDVMGTISKEVGPSEVSKAYEKLHNSSEVFTDFASMSEHIAKASGASIEDADQFLKMKTTETPAPIKAWLDESEDAKPAPEAEDKPADEAPPESEKNPMDGKEVYAILIPKDSIETSEELTAWAESSGWKSEFMEEDENDYVLVQAPKESFESEMQAVDLGDGIRALVGTTRKADQDPGQTEPENLEDAQTEGQEDSGKEKGLLDDTPAPAGDITGDPVPGLEPAETALPQASVEDSKQTNVLLGKVVGLLEQLIEKVSISQAPLPANITQEANGDPQKSATPDEVKSGDADNSVPDREEELAKQIQSFIERTESRLKNLGL